MRTSSFGRRSSTGELDSPENHGTLLPEVGDHHGYGAMLPIFLNDLRSNHHQELVEITLELEDEAVVLCNVASATASGSAASPSSNHAAGNGNDGDGDGGSGAFSRSLSMSHSITSRIRRKFPWLRSMSSRTSVSSESVAVVEDPVAAARNARRMRAKLERTRSSAQRALKGLRFISETEEATEELWRKVEERFRLLAEDGLLAREDFGECIGTLRLVWMLRK